MTEQPTKQRRDLRQRRAERGVRSAQAKQATWAQRYSAAQTPLDLYSLAYSLLRTRLVQFEKKAAEAASRARTAEEKERAGERLAAARAEVSRVCGEVAEYLAEQADQFDTTRK